MDSIFMVGEQRSGSNLVRLILNESPDIVGPHPPHILQRMMPLLPIYGKLIDEQNFRRLINDVCRLVEHNPVPWEEIVLDRDDVRKRCLDNSLVAVYGAVMDIYAEYHHARAWLCKSMQNIRWADEINEYFDKAKFIYLYRDPRDVTLSFMKAVIGDKHPYFIARQWADLQRLCLDQQNHFDKEQFIFIAYEDLVENTECVARRLCNFLNIKYQNSMLTFYNSGEASRTAGSSQLWENLARPILGNNTKKFMQELHESDIRIVESVTGDIMDVLGYERMLVKPGEELNFNTDEIATFRSKNLKRIQEMEQKTDVEDLRRRELQNQVLDDIKALASY